MKNRGSHRRAAAGADAGNAGTCADGGAPPNERKRTAYRCSGASGWRRTALLQTVKTSDGKLWWFAFTGFEEEARGSDREIDVFGGYGTVVCNRAAGRRRGRDHFESLEPDADAGKELIRIILGQQG